MGLTFVILGLLALVGAAVMWRRNLAVGRRAAAWPTAAGQVIASDVTEISIADSAMLTPYVVYAYQAAGQSLRSARLRLGAEPRFNSRARAQAMADRYPVGMPVSVRYDPSNPAMAVLDLSVGQGYGPLFIATLGATLLLFGLVSFFT